MKKISLFGFMLMLALTLQACSNFKVRNDTSNALKANDLDAFKSVVVRIQEDPSYSEEDRADALYTVFFFAAGKNLEATRYMLDQGVSIDYPANKPTSTSRGGVLRAAVEANKPEIVKLLLERGADPDIELWSIDPLNNILYVSFRHEDLVVTRILLEGGANPNLWSNPFYPSLLAHYDGYPDIKNILIEFGGVKDPTEEQRAKRVKGKQTKPQDTRAVSINKSSSEKSVEERLEKILLLKKQGLISEKEYSEARAKILTDL